MYFECLLLPGAEKEYLQSYNWYEIQQPGLGARFAKAFRDKIAQIAGNPLKYKVTKGIFRETTLGKPFPFVIVFFIDKDEKRVLISSIFHTSRHPGKKFRKK